MIVIMDRYWKENLNGTTAFIEYISNLKFSAPYVNENIQVSYRDVALSVFDICVHKGKQYVVNTWYRRYKLLILVYMT